jgi:carbonic anhydrase
VSFTKTTSLKTSLKTLSVFFFRKTLNLRLASLSIDHTNHFAHKQTNNNNNVVNIIRVSESRALNPHFEKIHTQKERRKKKAYNNNNNIDERTPYEEAG